MFITSIIIIIFIITVGNCSLALRRIRMLVKYACQQTCEHYLLTFFTDSLQLKSWKIKRAGIELNFEFKYGDNNVHYNGKAITAGFSVKEIILHSPKQNTNDDIFTPANDLKDNVIKFPNKKET